MGQRGYESLNKVSDYTYWHGMWDNLDNYTRVFLQILYINQFFNRLFTDKIFRYPFRTRSNDLLEKKKIKNYLKNRVKRRKKYRRWWIRRKKFIVCQNLINTEIQNTVDRRPLVSTKVWIIKYLNTFFILLYIYIPKKFYKSSQSFFNKRKPKSLSTTYYFKKTKLIRKKLLRKYITFLNLKLSNQKKYIYTKIFSIKKKSFWLDKLLKKKKKKRVYYKIKHSHYKRISRFKYYKPILEKEEFEKLLKDKKTKYRRLVKKRKRLNNFKLIRKYLRKKRIKKVRKLFFFKKQLKNFQLKNFSFILNYNKKLKVNIGTRQMVY